MANWKLELAYKDYLKRKYGGKKMFAKMDMVDLEKSLGNFLTGFKKESKVSEDFKEELDHLKTIYEKGLAERKNALHEAMAPLAHYMKQFLQAYDAVGDVGEKLDNLKDKMGCEECNDE